MKRHKLLLLVLIVAALAASTWFIAANDLIGKIFNESEPDMPRHAKFEKDADKEAYLQARNEHLDMLRGFDTATQDSRANAIAEMERGERELVTKNRLENIPEAASWKALGPAPIPVNASTSYSGRVSAIA